MISPIDGDLTGKPAIVTGASAGIGLETARDLAKLGAEVVLAVRDVKRGEAAKASIEKSVKGARLRVMQVELSSQKSVRAFCAKVLSETPKLHILVNNAGVFPQKREQSVDGIELTWATNVLAYFLTTELLRPRIAETGGRIVNVASGYAFGLELDDVEFKRRAWSGSSAYAQSKQANRMWTWALARRLPENVTANAMHPGAVDTNLLRSGWGGGGRRPEHGADTVSWLAAAREVEGKTGKFWMDRHERKCEFRGEEDEEALWALCAKMTGLG
ncbi:MAG: SDR family NAD(P)-dependent oxidoreductase [Deltaproteobacteria bacterium]|nr:SDR family NAD(P)-dependent oxidoreductase [Deltaproteobacteria bacterium]